MPTDKRENTDEEDINTKRANMSPPLVPRPLEGKLAIVTGSSRGIGAAIATHLASSGCSIILNHINPTSAPLAATLATNLATTHKITTLVIQADISTPAGVAHLISETKVRLLTPPTTPFEQVDILINNAGIALNAPLPSVTASDFLSTYTTNVLGPLLLTQALLPYLPVDRTGRIVNIGSVSSSCGFIGQSVYGGTKAALEAMTRTWARELGATMGTVNCVNPGPVEGEMYEGNSEEFKRGIKGWLMHTPLAASPPQGEVVGKEDEEKLRVKVEKDGGRAARVEEVAGVVGMLCLGCAGWCTGQVVCANGGMVI